MPRCNECGEKIKGFKFAIRPKCKAWFCSGKCADLWAKTHGIKYSLIRITIKNEELE